MKISKLELTHFRGARHLVIEFTPGVNLLVGVNGAGKSSVLDSLAIMLSWAGARLRSPNTSGRRIIDTDIHNERNYGRIELSVQTDFPGKDDISWRLAQTRKGRNPEIDLNDPYVDPNEPLHGMTSLRSLSKWASEKRDEIGKNHAKVNLPLFVYYPTNRSVVDIPLRIRKSHTFALLDAYDGALTAGANFRNFFEWYRNREDIENEHLRDSQDISNDEKNNFSQDSQLQAVRQATKAFMPGFSKISVKRTPLRMEVEKNGKKYRVEQMSDGEKCLFAMIGDLARRLAIANPQRTNALEGEGVVLIDEIDLHLHPAWQRNVINQLRITFPNCQFIVSTHSPQVFGEVDAECIRRLSIDPLHGLVATTPDQSLGLDSSEVLEEQMEAQSRNEDISKKLDTIFELIDKDKFIEAKKKIETLRDEVKGSIPEIVRAESLITMLEPDEEKQS
ncbi:MAG: AAA family ATPase [Phycisphaerae bacterium]|nr:AAA family ATPase [Phycisphaerae bacterium]